MPGACAILHDAVGAALLNAAIIALLRDAVGPERLSAGAGNEQNKTGLHGKRNKVRSRCFFFIRRPPFDSRIRLIYLRQNLYIMQLSTSRIWRLGARGPPAGLRCRGVWLLAM